MGKKIITLFILFLFALLVQSCPENRKFEHKYYYVPVDANGHIIYEENNDGVKTFRWAGPVVVKFGGGENLYWYYDDDDMREKIVAKHPDVKTFIFDEDAEIFEEGNVSGTNCSIEGTNGERFKIPTWLVEKNGKLVPYSGTGCEDLVFYAVYKKET